jgi:hypothetical protein
MEQAPAVIFATPDFGASGGMACFVLLAWAFVLMLAAVGAVRGVRLLGGGSPQGRNGVLLVLVSVLAPVACCLGPSHVVRLMYGNYPLGSYPNNKIHEGMTADEVVAILGTPHERHKHGGGTTDLAAAAASTVALSAGAPGQGPLLALPALVPERSAESWLYWIDSFSIGWFGLDFGPDGRVVHTYGS